MRAGGNPSSLPAVHLRRVEPSRRQDAEPTEGSTGSPHGAFTPLPAVCMENVKMSNTHAQTPPLQRGACVALRPFVKVREVVAVLGVQTSDSGHVQLLFYGCFLFFPTSALNKVSWLVYKANFGSGSSRDPQPPPLPPPTSSSPSRVAHREGWESSRVSVKLPGRVRGSADVCQVGRHPRLQPRRLPALIHWVSAPVPLSNLISCLLLCATVCYDCYLHKLWCSRQ